LVVDVPFLCLFIIVFKYLTLLIAFVDLIGDDVDVEELVEDVTDHK